MAANPHASSDGWLQLVVRPGPDGWDVEENGAATATFPSREDALDYARGTAVLAGGGTIRVCDETGATESREAYLSLPGEREARRLRLDDDARR